MSKFSGHLDKCISNSGMTENQLAKISGFNRSYIALMKNGQRVSPDTEKMVKLLDALALQPFEHDSLWSEYIQERMGKDRYKVVEAIKDLIESMGSNLNISVKSQYHHEIPDIKTIDNIMDLNYMIKVVIEEEARKEDGKLYLIMQPDKKGIFGWLPGICKNSPGLKIEHIVCMERDQESNEKDQVYNIQILKELFKMMLADENFNYEAYYYYDRIVSHFDTAALMPSAVITSEYVINIAADFEHALVLHDAEIIQYYQELFRKHKQKCKTMFRKVPNYMDAFEFYDHNTEWKEEKKYVLAAQPCFGILDSEEMVKKYAKSADQKVVALIQKWLANRYSEFQTKQTHMVCYATKEGLRRFAEQGIVDEIPEELYHKLERKDSVHLLKNILEMMAKGKYDIYLVDDQEIHLPQEVYFSSLNESAMYIMYLGKKKQQRFLLNEKRIAKLLVDFLTDFPQFPYSHDKERSVVFIEELIEQYGNGEE